MIGLTKWPPICKPATPLIKTQAPCDHTWDSHKVQVMRFYDTYVKARQAVPKFIADSHYETDTNQPPMKRRRIRPSRFESSSEEDIPIRKSTKVIAAPPPVVKGKIDGKGQISKADQKAKDRKELMDRLVAARAAAAAKVRSPKKSPRKTPEKAWKVTPLKDNAVECCAQTPERPETPKRPHTPKRPQTSKHPENHERPETPDFLKIMDEDYHYDGGHFMAEDCMETSMHVDSPSTSFQASPRKSKTPTYKTFTEVPDGVSFHLSPPSARAVTDNLNKKQLTQGGEGAVKPSTSKSVVDGRKRLFLADTKSDSERLEALESTVLTLEVLVRELSSKSDIILMNLGRVQRHFLPNEKRITKPPGMPKLPLGSVEELQKFEQFLEDSDTNLAGTCDYLSTAVKTLVPDPERVSARAILQKLLYNNLAKQMNLDGGNDKIGFRGLLLYKVFQGTLQSAFQDSDLSVAENSLQGWLKDAKWRKQMPVAPGSSSSSSKPARGSEESRRGSEESRRGSREGARQGFEGALEVLGRILEATEVDITPTPRRGK